MAYNPRMNKVPQELRDALDDQLIAYLDKASKSELIHGLADEMLRDFSPRETDKHPLSSAQVHRMSQAAELHYALSEIIPDMGCAQPGMDRSPLELHITNQITVNEAVCGFATTFVEFEMQVAFTYSIDDAALKIQRWALKLLKDIDENDSSKCTFVFLDVSNDGAYHHAYSITSENEYHGLLFSQDVKCGVKLFTESSV